MKKIFENAVWWSGVVMVGLVLGISLQFVRAWTEPTTAPPGGNVGAPINTGGNTQWKGLATGALGFLGLTGGLETNVLKIPAGVVSGTPQAGYVLSARKDPITGLYDGTVAWAPGGGGGWYVPTSVKKTALTHDGNFNNIGGGSSFSGYQEMNKFVQGDANCGSDYHVCSTSDITAYYQFHPQVLNPAVTEAWINGAIFDGSLGVSDCEGWRTNEHGARGYTWYRDYSPDYAECEDALPVMCCK